MNLYAICPAYAPNCEVKLVLAETDERAMNDGVWAAAQDVANGDYFSPWAEVFLVAKDIKKVGDAPAIHAPQEWEWAHPAVENNAVSDALQRAGLDD